MHSLIPFITALLAAGLVSSNPVVSIHVTSQRPLIAELPDTVGCSCKGTANGPEDFYVCGDTRLGPVRLPHKFPLLSVMTGYDRLAGLSPAEFLKEWTNPETGSYVYPPHDGYLLDNDGEPILANITLKVGARLDRFGGVWGKYLAAADAPFDQRSLPPSSLNIDPARPGFPFSYHMYRVKKPLPIQGGLIAPWFGQPGLGAQFWTGHLGNVGFLIENGYIEEEDPTDIPQPGDEKRCK